MSGSALAVREGVLPATEAADRFEGLIAAARQATMLVKQSQDVGDAREAITLSRAAEVYARAYLTAEHLLVAQEAHVWACRRAGEVRASLTPTNPGRRSFDWGEAKRLLADGLGVREVARKVGVTPAAVRKARNLGFRENDSFCKREYDEELKVGEQTGRRWEVLAAVSETAFTALVEDLKEVGRIGVGACIARIRDSERRLVERGIYLLPDGRYRIEWTRDRQQHKATLPMGTSLDEARRQLGIRRGKIKPDVPQSGEADLGRLYQAVTQARDLAGAVWPSLSREQKNELDGLYSSLDDYALAIVRATNL